MIFLFFLKHFLEINKNFSVKNTLENYLFFQKNIITSVVEGLSQDLKTEFPNTEDFSVQNLWYMRQLYFTYRNFPILQQLAGEIPWMRQGLALFFALKKMIWK
ncbi:MAG: DUF1016 family protein [Cytophagales bacterium]|nr:MAG: DUF1016 family protein [Cytophagales bacterium]